MPDGKGDDPPLGIRLPGKPPCRSMPLDRLYTAKRSLARGNISVPCGIAVPAWREIDGETAKLFEFSRLLQFREIRKDKRGENRNKLVTKFYRIPLRLSCIPIVTVMTTPLGINIKWKQL